MSPDPLLCVEYENETTTYKVHDLVYSQLSECVLSIIRVQDKTMIRLEANNSANFVVYSGSLLHLPLSLASLYTTVGIGLGEAFSPPGECEPPGTRLP